MHCSCIKAEVAWLPSLRPASLMHCPGPCLHSVGQLGALQDLTQGRVLGEQQWASPKATFQEAESEQSAEQRCPGSARALPRARRRTLGVKLICRPSNVVLGVKRSHGRMLA